MDRPIPPLEAGNPGSSPRQRNRRGQGEQLREDLIAAATRVLSGLGSDETLSLRAVARAAGVTAPAVYLHFHDLDQLILAVLGRLFDELAAVRVAAEEAAAADGGDSWQRLRARSHSYVHWGIEHPGAYRVLYEGKAVPRLQNPADGALGQAMLDRTDALIAELASTGRAEPIGGPERAGLLLWTALHGIVSLKIDKDTIDWPDAAELADQILEALLRPQTTQ